VTASEHAARASALLELAQQTTEAVHEALGTLRGCGVDGPLHAAGQFAADGVSQVAALGQAHALTAIALSLTQGTAEVLTRAAES
jgi:hypothetical protein